MRRKTKAQVEPFEHLCVVGVGLIGGSFAMAARAAGIARRVTGWDKPDVLSEALAAGVIDAIERGIDSEQPCTADLVYLAAPIGEIIRFIETRGTRLKAGCLLTDAGSTKRQICSTARRCLPDEVTFVGGHPMAGSHRSGLSVASPTLFSGAAYAVIDAGEYDTPAARTGVDRLTEIVRTIGARPVLLSAERHDRTVAFVSHLPQLMSSALAAAIEGEESGREFLELAGQGFYDTVRLAGSKWSVWQAICQTNGEEISLALSRFISQIESIKESIECGDLESLARDFQSANNLSAAASEVRLAKRSE